MFVILDLDGTIVDTTSIESLRAKKDWRGCIANCNSTALFNDIRDVIKTIRANEVRVGIVTNSVSYYALALLKHHRVQYDALICYHDTARHKPDPEPVLAAIRKMDCPNLLGWGIGDHASDCEAYRLAGISAAGAGWNPNLSTDVAWKKVIFKPKDILELVGIQ